jgi:hypothetical protein
MPVSGSVRQPLEPTDQAADLGGLLLDQAPGGQVGGARRQHEGAVDERPQDRVALGGGVVEDRGRRQVAEHAVVDHHVAERQPERHPALVRDQPLDQRHRRLAGVGLADHLPAADLLQQRAQHPADRRVVVDRQDPPGAVGARHRRLHAICIGRPDAR